jgi:AraC-like DNA-binding protein
VKEDAMHDLSDRPDGPSLFAFWGGDEPASEFRLGTREYQRHRHVRGQLFCVESGLVRLHTDLGSWLLPPNRAGWIPPGVDHAASVTGALSGWGVMLAPEVVVDLPDEPCVLEISDLLRTLVRRAASWDEREELAPHQDRLVSVLLDEIKMARRASLYLPMPVDARLLKIANRLIEKPDDERTLDVLAGWAGISARSARRLFLAETGMGFQQWRQQASLTLALERLAGGEAVAEVSDALGYATPSSFIAMFRRTFGDAPARYFAKRRV